MPPKPQPTGAKPLLDITTKLSDHYDLAPNPDLAASMADIYDRMDRVVSPADWAIYAPYTLTLETRKIVKCKQSSDF